MSARVPLQEAFDRLLLAFDGDGETACEQLDDGLILGRARLWCDGNPLSHFYIKDELRLRAEQDAGGRWRCVIRPKWPMGWERTDYVWEVAGVEALLPRRSRAQELLPLIAAKLWPSGYRHLGNKQIIKDVSDELKRRARQISKFLRRV